MSTDCRLLSTHAVVIVAAMPVGGSSNGVEIQIRRQNFPKSDHQQCMPTTQNGKDLK